MKRLAVLGAFALAGCDNVPKTWAESDIESIAYDAAEDVADARFSAVASIESRINELESKVDDQEREIDSLRSDLDTAEAHINNLYTN